jgi:hypothetical protein
MYAAFGRHESGDRLRDGFAPLFCEFCRGFAVFLTFRALLRRDLALQRRGRYSKVACSNPTPNTDSFVKRTGTMTVAVERYGLDRLAARGQLNSSCVHGPSGRAPRPDPPAAAGRPALATARPRSCRCICLSGEVTDNQCSQQPARFPRPCCRTWTPASPRTKAPACDCCSDSRTISAPSARARWTRPSMSSPKPPNP